ncbi:hypothetical protein Tco_0990122 [Tanacetum coccineum]|uniref:Uncharacterized protein n=1 Tax=Tanacetum coccineum TaxID=301880 RepID=A0ABQ5EWC8_9ASTR
MVAYLKKPTGSEGFQEIVDFSHGVHIVESLKTELKQTKQTYGAAFTKLIKKVKKLEQTIKTSQARKRAKIVVSDDEEASILSSNREQGVEEIVKCRSLRGYSTHSQRSSNPEDQLGVLVLRTE